MANTKSSTNTIYVRDLVERTLATVTQAAIAYIIVESANWQGWWVAPVAMGLALAKGVIAKYIGKSESASIDPSV
jgi:hypothetical protein